MGSPFHRFAVPLPRFTGEEKKLKAKVQVFLKPGVLDVQGKAVEAALHGLGWADVSGVRVGRTIEFDLTETDAAKAEAEVKAMCDKLLANTVIESYRVEIA
jgi:phosphoribosylformylglycinamidine synthase subunit PurS